jgi:uncharacterized protein
MNDHEPTPQQIMAFAVFELRLLLAGHLAPDSQADPATRAAARLAYSLHNQALAVLEGRSFDSTGAIEAIANVDKEFGENFVQQLAEAAKRGCHPS